jgi:hypothetical protein
MKLNPTPTKEPLVKRNRPYEFKNFLVDVIGMALTGCLWIIWVVIREAQAWRK